MPVNYELPIDSSRLQSSRLQLVPIENHLPEFAEEFVPATSGEFSSIWQYYPYGPFNTPQEYIDYYTATFSPSRAVTLFAIYILPGTTVTPRGKPPITIDTITLAGTTGLLNTQASQSTVELGHVLILPRFQGSWVQVHANAILLRYLLSPPPEGLQLRRVQWQCNAENAASRKAALKLGFVLEGVCRWQRVLPVGKVGAHVNDGRGHGDERVPGEVSVEVDGRVVSRKVGPGRHSAIYSICWDDWVEGVSDHVEGLIQG